MKAITMHYHGDDAGLLHLGERVCAWLRERRLTAKEVALAARLDVRTARGLFEGSCGVRAFDSLATTYGWSMIEAVMTPAVGVSPLDAKEAELAQRIHESAALHARVERERAVSAALDDARGPALRVVAGEVVVRDAPLGGEG